MDTKFLRGPEEDLRKEFVRLLGLQIGYPVDPSTISKWATYEGGGVQVWHKIGRKETSSCIPFKWDGRMN